MFEALGCETFHLPPTRQESVFFNFLIRLHCGRIRLIRDVCFQILLRIHLFHFGTCKHYF